MGNSKGKSQRRTPTRERAISQKVTALHAAMGLPTSDKRFKKFHGAIVDAYMQKGKDALPLLDRNIEIVRQVGETLNQVFEIVGTPESARANVKTDILYRDAADADNMLVGVQRMLKEVQATDLLVQQLIELTHLTDPEKIDILKGAIYTAEAPPERAGEYLAMVSSGVPLTLKREGGKPFELKIQLNKPDGETKAVADKKPETVDEYLEAFLRKTRQPVTIINKKALRKEFYEELKDAGIKELVMDPGLRQYFDGLLDSLGNIDQTISTLRNSRQGIQKELSDDEYEQLAYDRFFKNGFFEGIETHDRMIRSIDKPEPGVKVVINLFEGIDLQSKIRQLRQERSNAANDSAPTEASAAPEPEIQKPKDPSPEEIRAQRIATAFKTLGAELNEKNAAIDALNALIADQEQQTPELVKKLKGWMDLEEDCRQDLEAALPELNEKQHIRKGLIAFIERHGSIESLHLTPYENIGRPQAPEFSSLEDVTTNENAPSVSVEDLAKLEKLEDAALNALIADVKAVRSALVEAKKKNESVSARNDLLRDERRKAEEYAKHWDEQQKRIPDNMAQVDVQIFELQAKANELRSAFNERFTQTVQNGHGAFEKLVQDRYDAKVAVSLEAYRDLQKVDLDPIAVDNALIMLMQHWADAKGARSLSQGMAQQELEKGLAQDGLTIEEHAIISDDNGAQIHFHWDKKRAKIVINHFYAAPPDAIELRA